MPGVPFEMQEIMLRAILPDLTRRAGTVAVIRSRTLRTWGESESGLAERLAPGWRSSTPWRPPATAAPTLAFLASGIEGLKVRITVKADDDATADRLLDAEAGSCGRSSATSSSGSTTRTWRPRSPG